MRRVFSWNIKVRSYDIGRDNHVTTANFVQYLEETAMRGSADCGYDSKWFETNGYLWVIRKWMIRLYQPVHYGDELQAHTWVSDFRRVQSHREYELLRNGERVLRARANWVFIDSQTMRPQRLLPEFRDAYQPSNETLEDLQTCLDTAEAMPDTPHFEYHHRVRYYELDKIGHVNNANYFRWVEEAQLQALRRIGWESPLPIVTHEMEYKQGTDANAPVIISSWIPEATSECIAWLHEIRHATTASLLARDYVTAAADRKKLLNAIQNRVL